MAEPTQSPLTLDKNPFPLLLNVEALKTAALAIMVGVLIGIWLCKSKRL